MPPEYDILPLYFALVVAQWYSKGCFPGPIVIYRFNVLDRWVRSQPMLVWNAYVKLNQMILSIGCFYIFYMFYFSNQLKTMTQYLSQQ